jgi:hypothetical protein
VWFLTDTKQPNVKRQEQREQNSNPSPPSDRTARLGRDGDGDPLAAVVVLGPDDLRALGVELDGSGSVAYGVVDGKFRVEAGEPADTCRITDCRAPDCYGSGGDGRCAAKEQQDRKERLGVSS